MLLAANVFDSVVNSLESDGRHGGGEHRRDPRVLLATRVTIFPCPHGLEAGLGAPLSVPVRDLSRGGLRFLLPRRLPLDTQFVAVLPGGADPSGASGPSGPPVGHSTEAGRPTDLVEPTGFAAPAGAERPVVILCGVAYWQPLAKDLFAIGGHFVRPLSNFPLLGLEPRIVLPGEIAGEPSAGPGTLPGVPADPARKVAS